MNLKQLNSKYNYTPAPRPRQENTTNENVSFSIRVLKLDLPDDLIKEPNEQIYIRASLFDLNYKVFFGKQWASSALERIGASGDTLRLECDQAMYFHTSFMDEYLFVVLEIIRFKTEDNQVSLGWCSFNLLKNSAKVTDLNSNKKPELISIEVFKGTPRALFHLTGSPEADPRVKTFDRAFLHLHFHLHKNFNVCHSLIPDFFLVHEDDSVPGLDVDADGYRNFDNPKLTQFHTYSIEKVKIFIEPSLIDFEKQLLENINKDRLERDENVANKNPNSLKIIERRLRVGVHNGLMYVEDNDTIYLNVQDPLLRRTSTSRPSSVKKDEKHNCLTANNSVEIAMPIDKDFTIVFILEYSISEQNSADGVKELSGITPSPQHTYQIRYITYQPFATKVTPDLLKEGILLELDFSGDVVNAPENTLVYKSDSPKKDLAQGDGDKTLDLKNGSRLTAIMKEKDITEREPVTSVSNTSSMMKDYSIEEQISVKESRKLAEVPKVSTRKSKQITPPRDNGLNITDANMRTYQQVIHQQRSSQQESTPKYLSESLTMPPTSLGVPVPNDTINIYHTKRLGEDMIVDFESIDSYVVNEHFSPTACGKSSRMFPLQMRSHHGLGLSRAIYSKIHAAGFQEIIDCNGSQPFVIDTSQGDENVINFNLEEKDHKQCNEIIFQFMALSRFPVNGNNLPTKSVFFTFQFYRFPVVSTDRLILDKIINEMSNYERSAPMILRKTDESGMASSGPPGTMVKYMLDPTFMKPGEMFGFIEYLNQQVLHIDVWDGDSLLLIGSCAVKLKNLCRQGKTSVQVSYELDIINQIEEETSSDIAGRLHIRMANLGSVSSNRFNGVILNGHHRKGMIIDATDIERFPIRFLSSTRLGGSMKDIYNKEDNLDGTLSYANVTVRPQPAVAKNRELMEMVEKRLDLSPVKKSLINEDVIRGVDHDKARKLERFKNALKRLENETFDINDNKLILEAKRADKAEKQRVLQTIQCYREQQKGETIRNILNGVIEKETVIYPKFGCTEIFEVKIKNHFNIDSNVNIEMSDSNNYLAPVINPQELRALKTIYSITTSSENDLINYDKEANKYQIFMKAKESVIVPFKYTNMSIQANPIPVNPTTLTQAKQSPKLSSQEMEYKIVFRTSENKLLSILRIKVIPQPPVIDQTFRFFHPEQSFLKRLIRLPPLHMIATPNDSIKILGRCTDQDVLTDSQPAPIGTPPEVHIKVPCGPAPQVRQFLVALYVDKFLLKPIQIWHFTVHSKSRIDVVAHQGQATNMILLLKGTSNTHNVQVFTSHPEEMSVGSIESQNFTLNAHTTYELSLNLTPIKIGNRQFQVNVVDIDSHTLIRSWMICAICKEPEISKMFEMHLPVGGGNQYRKRVGFQNPYPHKKRFYLFTDRPDLMALKDSMLTINANEVENICMVFHPINQRGRQKVFVFINDEDGKNEETFALIVNYQ